MINNKTINLHAYLRDNPETIQFATDFIDKRLPEIKESRTSFRATCKVAGDVFFGGHDLSAIKRVAFKNVLKFLNGGSNDLETIRLIEEELYQYITGQDTAPKNHYASLSKYNDGSLTYYKDRNLESFLDLHLDILRQAFATNKEFEIFQKRLLRDTLDGKEYIFPAVNLLEENAAPLSIVEQMNFAGESTTSVPQQFIDAVKEFMPKMTDGQTYTLNNLNKESNALTLSTSSYFKALYSCDRFFYYIVTHFPGINSENLDRYKHSLTMEEWAQNLKDIVINNKLSADASIGCSCLLVYKNKNDNGYEYTVGSKTASSNGYKEMHVIPSSMFQPLTKNPFKYTQDKSVLNHVLKELSEEIFKTDDFESEVHSDYTYKEVLNIDHNKSILDLLETGGAEFHITGLWLDMFRLRPEITCTLIIHDKSWAEKYMTDTQRLGNWEVEKGCLHDTGMVTDNHKMILKRQGGFMCAPGLAGFISGIKKFNSLNLDN